MKFDFEWQEAPGVRDKVLAASWARLSLSVGERTASESIDVRSDSRRTGIVGPLFPLAAWLVEHWWFLLHEPSPHSPVPGGRSALPVMRGWVQRHNLLAARDGGALPDLTIARDGDEVLLKWEADPVSQTPARIRFVGQGTPRVKVGEVEQAMRALIEGVLARLEEKVPANEEVKRVAEAWDVICSADSGEAALCQSLAVMGVDPYDPDEASPDLIEAVERGLRVLPDELRADLFEGSDAESFANNLAWVESERSGLCGEINGAKIPSIPAVVASTPHELGYLTARRVRSELLGVASQAPVLDLPSALVDHLGWSRNCLRLTSARVQLGGDGWVGESDLCAPPGVCEPAQRARASLPLGASCLLPGLEAVGSRSEAADPIGHSKPPRRESLCRRASCSVGRLGASRVGPIERSGRGESRERVRRGPAGDRSSG